MWRVLCLPARQCSWSPNGWENQRERDGWDTCIYFTRRTFRHPTSQIWTRLIAISGDKCSSWSSKVMTLMNWSSAWSMSGIVSSKASSMMQLISSTTTVSVREYVWKEDVWHVLLYFFCFHVCCPCLYWFGLLCLFVSLSVCMSCEWLSIDRVALFVCLFVCLSVCLMCVCLWAVLPDFKWMNKKHEWINILTKLSSISYHYVFLFYWANRRTDRQTHG